MVPSPLQQRRTHNSLLFQKLLNLRDGASPFTLVLDTLEQSGRVVVVEFARRAKLSKSKIIFISFTTLQRRVPFEYDVFVTAIGKPVPALRAEIITHMPRVPSAAGPGTEKTLVIIDSLNSLASTSPTDLPSFLSSLLLSPTVSLLATYHTDIPTPAPPSASPYIPSPLSTLLYVATAILTISNFNHIIARKKARDKSLQEPVFGLAENREGVLVSLETNSRAGNLVVAMEVRRKSGRGVVETFVVSPAATQTRTQTQTQQMGIRNASAVAKGITFSLLDEHPLYAVPSSPTHSSVHANPHPHSDPSSPTTASASASTNPNPTSHSHSHSQTQQNPRPPPQPTSDDDPLTHGLTFNLHLTEKQRRDRADVVLPYFDAQKDGAASGWGEGGRILYDMGREDREDFDDEEDEI